jgi:lipopolysaccharide/colanic/teichoic acid biosynthesis glycosyltransferase
MSKRVIDLAVGLAALVVLAPVIAVVAVVVRLRLGLPVLFCQTRAGRDGRPFTLYKFRTMRPAGDGEDGPQHDAARLTRLGRVLRATSLDELPSLVNVVRGDMSLVGPRPLPMHYLPRYTPRQALRLQVRPGITGWAVIHGRNLLSWEERLELDCWYVEHRSLRLDLQVLWRTLGMVLRRTGVNHAEGVTMTEFEGS